MRRNLIIGVALVAFAAFCVYMVVHRQKTIQLKNIQLQSKSTDLKTLQLKFQTLNTKLDTQLQQKTQDETKVQDLEKQKTDLQQQLDQAQKDLQAKRNKAAQDAQVAQRVINTVTATKTAYAAPVASGGSREDWMATAGISPNDYSACDFIVSHESGWRVNASNPSGAFGIPQSLPGSKMASAGADWETNPVTQLKWMKSYVEGRYGGFWGAYNYWQSHSNY